MRKPEKPINRLQFWETMICGILPLTGFIMQFFYSVSALLLSQDLNPTTHKGAKSNFSEHFVKNGIVDKEYGKLYTQLFIWRHKGDYDDLFGFDKQIVEPYFEPVKKFINLVESRLQE